MACGIIHGICTLVIRHGVVWYGVAWYGMACGSINNICAIMIMVMCGMVWHLYTKYQHSCTRIQTHFYVTHFASSSVLAGSAVTVTLIIKNVTRESENVCVCASGGGGGGGGGGNDKEHSNFTPHVYVPIHS